MEYRSNVPGARNVLLKTIRLVFGRGGEKVIVAYYYCITRLYRYR